MEDWREQELRSIHETDMAVTLAIANAAKVVAMTFIGMPLDVSLSEAPLSGEWTVVVRDTESGEERHEPVQEKAKDEPWLIEGATAVAALQAALPLVRAHLERLPPEGQEDEG